MKIKSIKVKNFCSFPEAEADFDGRSAVLIGDNGSGKSTLLKAITILFSDTIRASLGRAEMEREEITVEDIRFGTDDAEITGWIDIGGNSDFCVLRNRSCGWRQHCDNR